MGIFDYTLQEIIEEETERFNTDRNEILELLKPYKHNSLPTLIVEYDNIVESARVGFYTQYKTLPTALQEIEIGYAVLDNMMEKYVK